MGVRGDSPADTNGNDSSERTSACSSCGSARPPPDRIVFINDALRIPCLESLRMKGLSPVETYLQDFHQRQPGATSTAFAHLRARSSVADYPSSYAAVAACVPESK